MIDNLNIIEKGSALPGQMQTPCQQKQRNWRHSTILGGVGLTSAPLTGRFNYFINHIRTLILDDFLIISFFLMMYLLFMIFFIGSVIVCIF